MSLIRWCIVEVCIREYRLLYLFRAELCLLCFRFSTWVAYMRLCFDPRLLVERGWDALWVLGFLCVF